MKKVLIIGANGFIGSALSKKFSEKGYEVVAMVGAGTEYAHVQKLEHIRCVEFSLSQMDDVLSLVRELGEYELAYMLAWVGVSTTVKNDYDIQIKNVEYMMNTMHFLHEVNVKKVVIPGSASEFAYCEVINSDSVPAPSDYYSAAKISARYLCNMYAQQNDMELICPVISSIYGPGRCDNNLITYTIRSLLCGEEPKFTKLEQQWDYIYLDDAIDALIAVGKKGIGGKVYPIGSGVHRQLREYVEEIRTLINPDASMHIGAFPYKTSRIDNQVMDITKLVEDTGFIPQYSFEQGIQKTIAFFKSV